MFVHNFVYIHIAIYEAKFFVHFRYDVNMGVQFNIVFAVVGSSAFLPLHCVAINFVCPNFKSKHVV